MSQITLDLTGGKGLSPKFFGDLNKTTSSPNIRYNAEDGTYVEGFFNPMIRDGYCSPANYSYKQITASGNSNTFGAVPRAFLDDLAVSSKVYAATNTRLRNSANIGSFGADGYSEFSSSATSVGTTCDLEMYQVNSVRKLFIAADNKISIYDTLSDTYDTAWSTTTVSGATTPTASDYSRLIPSDNGFLYWLVGNLVYKIDGTAGGGTNGTLSLALTFPTNRYLYDGVSSRGKLFLAINPDASTSIRNNQVVETRTSKECGIYVWDRSAAITALSDFFVVPGVHQIRSIYIAPNGEVRVIAVATNRMTIMFKFDGSKFIPLYEFPPGSYPNQPKAVGNGSGITYWLGNDGILYANVFPTGGKEYIVQLLNCNTVATAIAGAARTIVRAGAILVSGRYNNGSVTSGYRADYDALILSWRDSNGDDTVIRYLPNSFEVFDSVTPVAAQGNVYTPVKLLPSLSKLDHITIYCAPTTNSSSSTIATLKFYVNGSTTAFKSVAVTKQQANRGYITVELNKLYVNSFQMKIEWETSQTLGVDDFCPSLAIVNYTPVSEPIPKTN